MAIQTSAAWYRARAIQFPILPPQHSQIKLPQSQIPTLNRQAPVKLTSPQSPKSSVASISRSREVILPLYQPTILTPNLPPPKRSPPLSDPHAKQAIISHATISKGHTNTNGVLSHSSNPTLPLYLLPIPTPELSQSQRLQSQIPTLKACNPHLISAYFPTIPESLHIPEYAW